MRGGVAIESDRVWRSALMPDRLLEEGLCCGYIPSAAEPEVNRLARLVHRPIQIGPLAADLDIGLIHSPGATSGPAKAVPPLDELWGVTANPTQDGRMSKTQTAFGHHLDQIAEAELVAQVPEDAEDDHLTVEVPTCKHLFNAPQSAHPPSSTPQNHHSTGRAVLIFMWLSLAEGCTLSQGPEPTN